MPSPVGHSLIGYSFWVASVRSFPRLEGLVVCLLAANAPDFDFIPGIIAGHPNLYHHGISHSLGFSLLFAATCSVVLYLLKPQELTKTFTLFFGLYFSHAILDYFSIDTSWPYGAPIFWPFSHDYYIAPFAFLPDIRRVSSSPKRFFVSLFSLHNLWAITVEVLLMFPLVMLVRRLRNSRNQFLTS